MIKLIARRSRTALLPALAIATMGAAACSADPDNAGNRAANNLAPASDPAPLAGDEALNDMNAAANAMPAKDGNTSRTAPTDSWVGKWTGPEGLFLTIQPVAGEPGRYSIRNRDTLDREAGYTGIADGATIRFVRDGNDMVVRPGTGAETGFKWLADKTDCLIVVPGQEGYCR